jgi:hypothetical protein
LINSLAYPLDFFEYEQQELLNFFNDNFDPLRHGSINKHRASTLLEQNFIEKNFPKLFNNVKQIITEDDVFFARFFLTLPKSKGDIHVDTRNAQKNLIREFSLNLPITNCHGTYHEWYDIHDHPYTEFAHSALFWRNYELGTLIQAYELTVPTILKVSIPHRINNPLDECRIAMAIRTKSNSFKYTLA